MAALTFTKVTGRNTTPLTQATVAPSAIPPSQNTFALLIRIFSTANDDDVDQTEGTAREDGDSQPLLDLDTITDPIINTLTAHDRVLTSTIAGVAEANRSLDLAITGVATALDDDNDNDTDAHTMALLMPMIPHGDVTEAPTMATFMLVLHSFQSQNQAILTRLDSMDDTSKQRYGQLRAEITSKADSAELTRLDHQLEVMPETIRDDIKNQLTSATASIVDIKANLSHVTSTHAAQLKKLDNMIVTQHACLDSYSTSYNDRFAALEQHLSSPTEPPRMNVVDPSL